MDDDDPIVNFERNPSLPLYQRGFATLYDGESVFDDPGDMFILQVQAFKEQRNKDARFDKWCTIFYNNLSILLGVYTQNRVQFEKLYNINRLMKRYNHDHGSHSVSPALAANSQTAVKSEASIPTISGNQFLTVNTSGNNVDKNLESLNKQLLTEKKKSSSLQQENDEYRKKYEDLQGRYKALLQTPNNKLANVAPPNTTISAPRNTTISNTDVGHSSTASLFYNFDNHTLLQILMNLNNAEAHGAFSKLENTYARTMAEFPTEDRQWKTSRLKFLRPITQFSFIDYKFNDIVEFSSEYLLLFQWFIDNPDPKKYTAENVTALSTLLMDLYNKSAGIESPTTNLNQ